MDFLNLPAEIKTAGDTGLFSGYAAIFGNVDLGGDVIERNAFTEMVKNGDGRVVVLWQHKHTEPLGTAKVEQDEKGLYFEGQLVMEDPLARRAHAHMKAKSVNGMSIGYDVMDREITNAGIRHLKSLKLWEISPVTFGMNPLAGIDGVKEAGNITNIREYEDFLRDVGKFSKAQAKLLASAGWKALPDQRDADGGADPVQQMIDDLKSIQRSYS